MSACFELPLRLDLSSSILKLRMRIAKRRHQPPYPEHSSVAHCQGPAAALRAGVITNADQEPLPAFLKIYIAVSLPALNHVVKVDRKRRR